jgi:DNA-binding transcriptional MerR regulator
VTINAIRFCEKAGLRPTPARSKSGYRLDRAKSLEDLAFISKGAAAMVFA